jgi:hypothetical protein
MEDEMSEISDLIVAMFNAIRNVNHWRGGAVVVRDGDGYTAIPATRLNSRNYTGSRDVVWKTPDVLWFFPEDLSDDMLMSYIEWALLPEILPDDPYGHRQPASEVDYD